MRRLVAVGAISAAALIGLAGPAFADDCGNASRKAGDVGDTKGRWTYIDIGEEQFWAFDKPGDAVLLDGSHACTLTRFNAHTHNDGTVNGIWSGECIGEALGG